MTSLAHAQLLQISPKTGVKSVYEDVPIVGMTFV